MKKSLWAAILIILSLAMVVFGQSERQRITYKGFPGGLNSQEDFNACLPTQLRTADQATIGDNGRVILRNGFTVSDAGVASYAENAFKAEYGGATEFFYKLRSSVYRQNGITLTAAHQVASYSKHNDTNTYAGQFVLFQGTVIHAEGASTPVYFPMPESGTGTGTTNASDPVLNLLTVHNNRVFGANSLATQPILYETEVDSASNWASGAAWLISQSDPEPITGIGALRGTLYIFTSSSIYRMTGYAPAERTIETFNVGKGTVSPESIRVVELTGFGQCLFFINTANEACILSESGITEVSDYFQPTLDGYVAPRWRTGYDPGKKEIWISATQEQTDIIRGYSYFDFYQAGYRIFGKYPYPSPAGVRWPLTVHRLPTNARTMLVIKNEIFVYYNAGYVVKFNTYSAAGTDSTKDTFASSPYSVPYYMTIKTRDEDAGDDRYLKGWKRAYVTTPSFVAATATQRIHTGGIVTTGSFIRDTAYRAYFNSMNWTAWTNYTIETSDTISQVDIDYVTGPKAE